MHRFLPSFNSKLVRLKGQTWKSSYDRIYEFQFQTGSIKSQHIPNWVENQVERFNSKLVRLKVDGLSNWIHLSDSVSIPNWFD